MERETPGYAEDLDKRVQRIFEARLAASRGVVSGGGGPMVPPLSSAHRWENPSVGLRVPDLPDFGHREDEDAGRHEERNTPRRSGWRRPLRLYS